MKRIKIVSILLFLFITSCADNGFKKRAGGMSYKHIKLGEGREVTQGEWLKLQIRQTFNDSTIQDTHKTGPQYQVFDSLTLSKESYAIMGLVSVGDSLVFKVPGDSIFAKGEKKPPFYKKGGELVTYMKVLDILPDIDSVQRDQAKDRGMPMPEKNVQQHSDME